MTGISAGLLLFAAVLVLLVVLSALLLVLHLYLWWHSVRAHSLPRWLRILSFIPPLACVAGFRSRARFSSVVWLIVLAAYLVLRSQA